MPNNNGWDRAKRRQGLTSFCPLPRPYGKDVPRLDYWLAYETIMKKVGGRPHWAKVGCFMGVVSWAAAVS